MTSKLAVWGGGGHGKVVADCAQSAGWEVVAFIDRADSSDAGQLFACRTIAELDSRRTLADIGLEAVALGVGDNQTRLAHGRSLGELCAPPIIHATAAVSRYARLGRGTVVLAQAVVNAAAVIGAAVVVNSGAIVEHDCRLDDGVHVGPGAVLGGAVTVGEGALVGAGAVVIPSRRIGAGSIVGAGSVVLRDVPDGTVVVGNPASFLRLIR